MKRLVGVLGVALIASIAVGAVASASAAGPHPAKAKKKCKKSGWIRKKGKCVRLTPPPPTPSQPQGPHPFVRATLTWDGPASLWLQIQGSQGRAGYFSGEGVLNQIPDAYYSGDTGGPGPRTETFTDNIFSGGYNTVPIPNSNRSFSFTYCHGGSGATPSNVTLETVGANGVVNRGSWTIPPSSGPQPTGCATLNN
jgi:hypothetical protein